MTTITKFIVGTILSLLMLSCNINGDWGFGVRGNGNVQTDNRELSNDFDEIEISRGLDVYLTQGDILDLAVEADENLIDIIITEVENNTLYIYADENIASSRSQKVYVTFKNVNKITATSGCDVYSTNVIKADNLDLTTTSGSDMELAIEVDVVECQSSSGSDLRLSGTANTMYAEANSGSDIKAGGLKTRTCTANANSGADITVHASSELIAKASSGGDIKYYGNPDKVSKRDGVSGSVRKQ
ncbi:MAG: DUF2807 domain-containing protein [Flavobacteriaceae bacterium]|nr:DUF2807 domain-containing protein [Bacteroidia bacterium]MBT8288050.1 DUF2807 domain-containing protein [Bacteroidia bacterium]NNF75844.1 DUF2807 domain-containing protein [Flavobacteriaceae bacterium]NNK71841.1 DUF2807 domain-containing protein [Flavobacteriaceae bacterium]